MLDVKSELIVEVGGEGGSIKLLGTRVPNGWRFRTYAYDCVGEYEGRDESDWVDSWEAALALFDKYPWHKLYPLFVHPEFQKLLWIAVRESFAFDEVKREFEHSYKCPNCENGEVVLKRNRIRSFIGCSNYPECKFSQKLLTKAAHVWARVCFPRPSPQPPV